ncbi:predicted protein [Sclerotinia sclerotiorum 1980 UF-70]|uniref:Uncharacterized protein n=1 Tax=Sclerotinia sclerotiorum (strain ATCC 18683 / 1980 / Ss-1) TaxID=665079 RepID=A7EZ91_SCLS1|nr:predicted protein [Sclerotinia sclerotiorum 1980 UF-70]EDN94783.1 predicted protein [Sclerotinia sclerotiorum 1980 UF-70]
MSKQHTMKAITGFTVQIGPRYWSSESLLLYLKRVFICKCKHEPFKFVFSKLAHEIWAGSILKQFTDFPPPNLLSHELLVQLLSLLHFKLMCFMSLLRKDRLARDKKL